MRAHKSAMTRDSNPYLEPEAMGFSTPSPGKCIHSGWTDAKFESAKSLYLGGLSASQVATELNKEAREFVTRNSVIGVLNRRGVFKDRPESKIKRVKNEIPRRAPSVAVISSAPSVVHQPGPSGGISIMDLSLYTCRWIIGGTGHLAKYCGVKTEKVYCECHGKIAWQPRTEKQEKARQRGALWAAG